MLQPANGHYDPASRCHWQLNCLCGSPTITFTALDQGVPVYANNAPPPPEFAWVVQARALKAVLEEERRVAALLQRVVDENILFQGLREEEKGECVDAFFQTEIQAGSTVIEQGAVGDNFYVIEFGSFDVFKSGAAGPVFSYRDQGAFGELALMDSQPRAATGRPAPFAWRVGISARAPRCSPRMRGRTTTTATGRRGASGGWRRTPRSGRHG